MDSESLYAAALEKTWAELQQLTGTLDEDTDNKVANCLQGQNDQKVGRTSTPLSSKSNASEQSLGPDAPGTLSAFPPTFTSHKRIPGTRFVVDGFRVAGPWSHSYFLTHFHRWVGSMGPDAGPSYTGCACNLSCLKTARTRRKGLRFDHSENLVAARSSSEKHVAPGLPSQPIFEHPLTALHAPKLVVLIGAEMVPKPSKARIDDGILKLELQWKVILCQMYMKMVAHSSSQLRRLTGTEH
jgi:hypothetical protein